MIRVDPISLLVDVRADETLGAVEKELASGGFTLGFVIEQAAMTVGDWLAKGAPGAPSLFADPSDHLVAGLEATLPDGKKLEVRPGPRRAVGPDLTALVIGTGRRFGTIDRAWLRIHRKDARRQALPLPAGIDLDPPVSADEARLVDAIQRELGAESNGSPP